jgi:hypothetical protein
MHTLAQCAAGGLSGIVDYIRHTLLSSPLAPVCYRLNLHLESFGKWERSHIHVRFDLQIWD